MFLQVKSEMKFLRRYIESRQDILQRVAQNFVKIPKTKMWITRRMYSKSIQSKKPALHQAVLNFKKHLITESPAPLRDAHMIRKARIKTWKIHSL